MPGTVVVNTIQTESPETRRRVMTITWTATAGAASVLIDPKMQGVEGWYMYQGTTNPGNTAPTDNYGITLMDSDGVDLAGGLLAARDTANAERVNFGSSATGFPMILDTFTFAIADNAVAAATGTLKLVFTQD